MSVDILMATYNGEKYIKNQLLSLQQQTFSDWNLLIRDDGSTDNTLDIIQEFKKHDSRIKIIETDGVKGRGAGRNFLELTKCSSSKYVIFCDQDDIWFERKLELLVKEAGQQFEVNIPCLIYCDAYGYSDSEGVISVNSVSRNHAKNLKEFLFFNAGYQGCSILFNRPLCDMLADYHADYFYMHDDIVSLLAHTFGKVYFLDKPLMLYRQHASNVTGNVSYGLISKIKSIFNINSYVISAKHYDEKKSFYEAYNDQLSQEQKNMFLAYLRYPNCSLMKRIGIILFYGFSLGGSRLSLIAKTLLRRPIEC